MLSFHLRWVSENAFQNGLEVVDTYNTNASNLTLTIFQTFYITTTTNNKSKNNNIDTAFPNPLFYNIRENILYKIGLRFIWAISIA